MPLTRRQHEILEYLKDNTEHFEQAPTLDQLCACLGLRSRGSLHKHIQALIAEGYVEPIKGRHAGVRLTPGLGSADALPYLGKIAAGRQIAAVPQSETMLVPEHLRTQRDCYVLQVSGDSMREAGILDGDYAVIEHRQTASNGEIVVALVRGEETTLKRIRQESDRILLIAENPDMAPLVFSPSEVEIQGVLVGLMRNYG
ncbi:repressor LexA [Thiorhodococcus mannitoliphagus]|uniref:LexA repressor n=1 Tax=Thiorhodococcus mannitoliphagus TaxID=329406 RepID=A0A6P1DUS9_9GAMM|nr:transcriptional repressor LexA [Thiorhodococcus mannitoliphagus]NEX22097.1 repressor LexA [Thiorhodococcus mannitoliphagus]